MDRMHGKRGSRPRDCIRYEVEAWLMGDVGLDDVKRDGRRRLEYPEFATNHR